jgi:hypothetical protein
MGRIKSEGDACLEPQGLFPLNVPVLREGSRPPSCSLTILNIITSQCKINLSDFWGRLHNLPGLVSVTRAFGAGPDGLVSETLGGLCSRIPSLVYPPGLLIALQSREDGR